MDFESIRKSYKPERIKLLLVGESPPVSGKFFYLMSGMTTYTSRAFGKIFSRTFRDTPTFLKFFQDSDCYLEDLCRTPIDKMPSRERKAMLDNSVGPLSRRLEKHKPEAIAIVLKKIRRQVQEAISRAGLTCPVYVLPFAGNGHQNKYIQELSEILGKHIASQT